MVESVQLSNRLEITYLGILRIVVLIVATIFVVTAAFFLADGARRLTTSTEVTQDAVNVSPNEVLAGVAAEKDVNGSASSVEATKANAEKQKFEAFRRAAFASYYKAYAALAQKYNKPEDQILTPDQVADGLGYTLEAYQGGEDPTVRLFVDDASYASQIAAAANALVSDKRVTAQLAKYQSAQKTSQACSTEYVTRRMWDPTSMRCSNWYEDPMGCSVLRQVPVERCHPAYPAGITGPTAAFGQMDRGFRAIWLARQEQSAANAATKRTSLQLIKASGMPMLVQAAYVFGAFLVIMFLFLVVAMERHLRGISKAALEQASAAAGPRLRAAE